MGRAFECQLLPDPKPAGEGDSRRKAAPKLDDVDVRLQVEIAPASNQVEIHF